MRDIFGQKNEKKKNTKASANNESKQAARIKQNENEMKMKRKRKRQPQLVKFLYQLLYAYWEAREAKQMEQKRVIFEKVKQNKKWEAKREARIKNADTHTHTQRK